MAAIPVDEICKIAEREAQTKIDPVTVEERKPKDGKVWKIQVFGVDIKRAEGDAKGQPFRVRGGNLSNYIVSSKAGTPDPNSYVPIKSGPRDPSQLKPGQEDYGASIEIVLNPATSFGKALEYRDSKFTKSYEALKANNTLDKKTNQCDFILKNYGTDPMVPADKRGKPRPQAIVRLNLDFDKHPPNHKVKELQGRPKTEIYDYDTLRVVDGKVKFDLATGDGGAELTDKNAYQFITYDSHLVDFDVDFSCDKKSKSGYSMEKTLTRLIVKKRVVPRRDKSESTVDAAALEVAKQLSAERTSPVNVPVSAPTPAVLVSTPAPVVTPAVAPAATPASTTPSEPTTGVAEVSADALNAFMSGLAK